MAFWTKERLKREQAGRPLVIPYSSDRVEECAYALGVAGEYALTSDDGGGSKRTVTAGEHIVIPPGQFALLLTDEKIFVPPNALAFISIKAKFKLRGLINVSGFHVDPGFRGRLKFAVYNAGAVAIDLKPTQRLFLIWYCDLDQETEATYCGSHQGQDGITPDDVMSIRGIVVSPAGINSRIAALEDSVKSDVQRLHDKIDNHQNWTRPILTGLAVALAFFLLDLMVRPAIDRARANQTSSPIVTVPSSATLDKEANRAPAPKQ